jgi:hypothetical protein
LLLVARPQAPSLDFDAGYVVISQIYTGGGTPAAASFEYRQRFGS